MLDDTIISSPIRSNASIRETRLKRKNKRRAVDRSINLSNDHEQHEDNLRNLLNEFYKDSEEIDTKAEASKFLETNPAAVIKKFNPFELETCLALADRIPAQEMKKIIPDILQETDGFITCSSLNGGNIKIAHEKESEENKNSSSTITESELINCCHQAEKVFEAATPKKDCSAKLIEQQLTPTKYDNMVLVNSILKDFSQSPLSERQIIKDTSWQYSPEFRLRKHPVKNYSRKFLNRTKKANLNILFEERAKRNSSEYSDDHSSFSSLSIQEDGTFGENLNQSTITSTNNTQRLCENLLNLTEYYTQIESQQSLSDEREIQEINETVIEQNVSIMHNITALITDILSCRSTYSKNIPFDAYNSFDDFHGFSGQEYVVDLASNQQFIINPNLNKTHELNLCDILQSNVLKNREENNRLNDWNMDDCHDIFDCINTENALHQHNIHMKYNELLNVGESCRPHSANKKEYWKGPVNLNETTMASEHTGFRTASSKPITVSREARIVAAKILNNLPNKLKFEEDSHINSCDTKIVVEDVNVFENPEDYEWNDDCDLFLNFQTPVVNNKNSQVTVEQQELVKSLHKDDGPSTSKRAALGFTTAGGKNVHISTAAQKNAQKILKEFAYCSHSNYDYEEVLKKMKCNVYAKNHGLRIEPSPLSDKDKANTGLESEVDIDKGTAISLKDEENADSYLNEYCLESEQINKNENKTKNITNMVKLVPAQKEPLPLKPQPSSNKQFNNNMGFQTENGKTIETSTKARKSVQYLLEEFNEDPQLDYLNNLKSIKNDINKKYNKHKVGDKCTNIRKDRLSSEGNDDFSEVYKNVERQLSQINNAKVNCLNVNMDFKTANGKEVLVSAKAKQIAEKLLHDFDYTSDIGNYENDTKDMKTKIQIKNKDLELKSAQEDIESTTTTMNEHPSSPNVCNEFELIQKAVNEKRKISTDNTDLESLSKSPPVKMFKKSLRNSKSTFSEQSLKSPLNSAKQTLTVRKNLLSLTKKRKRNSLGMSSKEIPKISREICDFNIKTTTPIKSSVSLKAAEQTTVTPNLKEFFSNAPLTSTPHLNKTSKLLQTIEDSDLKPITWDNNNDSVSNKSVNSSMRSTKLSDSLSLNITLNSSNPTVKERIGRLKMYGKAPPVSPILIDSNHNCRPSGLRRTRSMVKKTEK